MARSYKRDSRGRFAGGGGGSGGGKRGGTGKASGSGGRKQNKSRVTTTGSFLTRGRAKVAQAKRTKAFSSKATVGRGAKEAYKAASGAARKAGNRGSRANRAGLTLKQNKDGKWAWFSKDGQQRTGAYKTAKEAHKSPEIEAKEQLLKYEKTSQRRAKSGNVDYSSADRKWNSLSDRQLKAMIKRDAAAARSLQNNKEFNQNGGRRSSYAMANQAAREAFDSARQAGRYLEERRSRRRR